MSVKIWFRAGATAVLSLALSTTITVAQDHDHGHDKHDRDDHDRNDDDRDHGHGNGHHEGHGHDRYNDHDREAARGWYHDHHDRLPPGLAKRDRLPPGLDRQIVVHGYVPVELHSQLHACPRDLEIMLPPPPPNYVHRLIGGHVVLVNRANFQIADVLHLEIY